MKKALIIILIIAAVLIGAFWGGQYYLNQKVDDTLKQKVNQALGGSYVFDYDRSHIDLFGNRAYLTAIRIGKSDQPKEEWSITLDSAAVKGFRWISLLQDNRIALDSVILINPEIRVDGWKTEKSDTSRSSKRKSPPEVEIGGIRTTRGKLDYDPEGPTSLKCDFQFSLNDISYGGNISDLQSLWRTSSVLLSEVQFLMPDSIYKLEAKEVSMTPADSTLDIIGATMNSTLGKIEFGHYFGWRKSRWHAQIDTISISRPTNFTDSIGFVSHIRVANVQTGFDKDLRLPWPDRVTKMPQPAIDGLGFDLRIDSVTVDHGELVINTIHEKGREAKIIFRQVSAELLGLQNVDKDSSCFVFDARGNLMNAAPVRFHLDYEYGEKSPFVASGFIGNTDLSFADDVLRKAAGIEVAKGRLTRLEFHMEGNQHGEGGNVQFHYENLKLIAVDKRTGESKVLLNLVAELASGLLFWKSNPNNGEFRQGRFYLERDVRKAFPSQWVDGLFQGILETVSKIDPARVRKNEK